MTQELIYKRIGRLATGWRMNNPTSEDIEKSSQAAYEMELVFIPDDGVRH